MEAYMSVYKDETAGNAELDKVIRQVQSSMSDCRERFEMTSALRQACNQVCEIQVSSERLERLSLLADVVKVVEDLEGWIGQQIIECNVCNNTFFKSETHRCPYCKAEDSERLIIAFLQELQPEAGEVLNMLQMMSLRRLRNYALNRRDMRCEILAPEKDGVHVMQELAGEQYDILICPDFSEQADYGSDIWREVFRVMKTEGIGLVSLPVDDEEQSAVKGLESLGFYVNVVGENWFGKDFYRIYGFDSRMVIFALTKDRALTG